MPPGPVIHCTMAVIPPMMAFAGHITLPDVINPIVLSTVIVAVITTVIVVFIIYYNIVLQSTNFPTSY